MVIFIFLDDMHLLTSLFLAACHSIPSPGQQKNANPSFAGSLLTGRETPLEGGWVVLLSRIPTEQDVQQLGVGESMVFLSKSGKLGHQRPLTSRNSTYSSSAVEAYL